MCKTLQFLGSTFAKQVPGITAGLSGWLNREESFPASRYQLSELQLEAESWQF
jgi:hypothetical protein